MSSSPEAPTTPVRVVDETTRSPARQPQSPNEKKNGKKTGKGGFKDTKHKKKPANHVTDSGSSNGSAAAANSGHPFIKAASGQASSTKDKHDNKISAAVVSVDLDKKEAISDPNRQAAATMGGAVMQADNTDSKDSLDDSPCKTFQMSGIVRNTDLIPTTDVDRFDTRNSGDVIKYFFTSDTRNRALSPVQEQDCINIQYHEESDLFIKAKGADGPLYVFEVHSGILAASCPVFNRMVYSTHTRGNKEEWIWELEDKPIGLKAMFSILHHNVRAAMFMHNPRPDQLYDVLSVLDKYGVPDRVFHPLAKAWIEEFRKSGNQTMLKEHELLYVAYKLGDFKSFKKHIRPIAHEVEALNGAIRLHGKAFQDIVPVSDQLVEIIKTVRVNDLKLLLGIFKEAFDFLMDDTKNSEPRFCKSVDHHSDCHQKLLGSLLSHLVRDKLYPFPDLEIFEGSASKLMHNMRKMDMRGLYLPGLEPHKQRHGQCRLDLEAWVQKVENESELPLSSANLELMYLASKRVGMFKDDKAEFETYKAQMTDMLLLHRRDFSHHVRGWEEHEGETDVDSLFSEEEEDLS